MTEKTELEEAIDALERAIKVLAGVGSKTGLLQDSTAEYEAFRLQAMASVRSVIRALPRTNNLSAKRLAVIESLVKELQEPGIEPAKASYTPASATVQGILKDMYDTFTADLETQTQEEAQKQTKYEKAVASMVDEIEETKKVLLKKEELKAEAMVELADKVQELDDSKKEELKA